MTVITLSRREFNQDSSRAKKAAEHDPTFITDRGKPAHVLLTIDDYRKLAGQEMTLADALAAGRSRVRSAARGRDRSPAGFVVTFVLDTNVLSELRRSDKADAKAAIPVPYTLSQAKHVGLADPHRRRPDSGTGGIAG